MRKLFYLSLVVGLGLTSCSKDSDMSSKDPSSTKATTLKEMTVPANFDWKTTHTVTINIEGVDVYYDKPNQMVVKNSKGQVILTQSAKMTEDVTLRFELPQAEETVTVEYGSIVREVNVSSGSGSFSYMEEPDARGNDSEEPQFDEKELEPFIED